MKFIVMPGYKDLFGHPKKTYEDLLVNISSNTVIQLIISLNNELNTDETHTEKQQRLIKLISYRYSKEQLLYFQKAFTKYKERVPHYDGTLFGRRYLLGMLLKELKRNNKFETDVDNPQHEFNFLLAYLICVDEINKKDYGIFEKIKGQGNDSIDQLSMVWAGTINQYELNHNVNSAFELFRLLCFSKYCYESLKTYIKELINKNGFKSLSEFLSSFYQLVDSTLKINQDQVLKKLNFIVPTNTDDTHLKMQSINSISDTWKLGISDLKKFPLYETSKRGFMIIDEDFYRKKLYKGPLFDTYYETSLKGNMKFTTYKTNVSKDAFEKVCFKAIINSLNKSIYNVIHFDDNSTGCPDLYVRIGKKILLFEFKDYLFPDSIIESKDVNAIRKYIDERFIISEEGQEKGINQLASHIQNLFNGQLDFDTGLVTLLKNNKKVKIYPVICHTDFMFSMPGINDYLDKIFKEKIDGVKSNKSIENLTLFNLEVLFDFAVSGGDFTGLITLIDRYWRILGNRKSKLKNFKNINNFLTSMMSFDELFERLFKKELMKRTNSKDDLKMKALLDSVNFNQEFLDEIL